MKTCQKCGEQICLHTQIQGHLEAIHRWLGVSGGVMTEGCKDAICAELGVGKRQAARYISAYYKHQEAIEAGEFGFVESKGIKKLASKRSGETRTILEKALKDVQKHYPGMTAEALQLAVHAMQNQNEEGDNYAT